jgi:hypothetical protein
MDIEVFGGRYDGRIIHLEGNRPTINLIKEMPLATVAQMASGEITPSISDTYTTHEVKRNPYGGFYVNVWEVV